jgi:hypothetical protein
MSIFHNPLLLQKNKTNKGNDCTKLTDIMPETKIPLFLRKKADSVLRNESKDKTEKASSSGIIAFFIFKKIISFLIYSFLYPHIRTKYYVTSL